MRKDSASKIIASILCANMFLTNTSLNVLASEISGVNPTGNTYNIEAAKVSGDTGFRHYDKFNLTQGDIANLIYKDGYSKFVNLVNNQININGIVNTMKGNNFYNGHAIFVSPNGMIVGASGVLNVGSLSVLTPSQSSFDSFTKAYTSGSLSAYEYGAENYNNLITDSHGDVVINGKILARGDVNIYGDDITLKGTASDKAGIIAGWNDDSTVFTGLDNAKNVFNNLVSNNITDTTNFALENGKVQIVAGFKDYEDEKPDGTANQATVSIENANIGASDIVIKANSTRDSYILANSDEDISSKIDITNSNISGNSIDILANSESSLSRNTNLTVPAVLLWIFDGDAHVDEFFSDGVYTGFEGVRTSAIVNVIDSVLNSIEDLSIATKSSSETTVTSAITSAISVSQFVPALFYGYGNQTESKINIKNSTLNAGGDIDLNAFSNNVLKAVIADECFAGLTIKITDAFNLAFMKDSSIADTKITIDNSKLTGKNVSAKSTAYNEMDNRNLLTSRLGKNDFAEINPDGSGTGGSAISLGGILNATDIKSAIEIINNSEINAKEDVTINAYNINDVSNWVDSEITDPLGYTNTWQDPDSWISKQFDRLGRTITAWDQVSTYTIKDFVTKFTNKTRNIGNQIFPEGTTALEKANFQSGAAVVWNNENTTTNVKIENSKISANNINIKSHTVDLTANEADAYAEETANWGGAFSVVVNKQNNNNSVNIIDSTLNSKEDTKIDSIVELPAQQGTLGISNKYLTLGVNFGFSADDDWSFSLHDITSDNASEKILPEAGIFGFYNNFGVASSSGDKASISASVVYSELNNNSDINISNSSLTSNTGSIIMNSIVSASAHDAVDFVNFNGLMDEIKSLAKSEFNKWNHESGIGAGGSVLIQDFTNNARITVDNSTLTAKDGNVELNTAAEQSYLDIITPGGKAETFGLTGAVTVQNIHGTTGTTVKNKSELNADKISINSGKANVQLTKKGSDMKSTGLEFLNDDNEVELADTRDVNDKITAVAINGSLTKQSEESQETTSSGVALGASVIAQNIDRNIKTSIQNSTLTATTIDTKAETKTRNIFITAAGAFAGGVTPDTEAQREANAVAQAGNPPEENAQEMENFGNWMDIIDDANVDDEDILGLERLFNENNPNAEGAQNAAGQVGGNNQLANNVADPQGAADNFSLALAGSVSVSNDKSVVATEIVNSTLSVGDELNTTANKDNFMLNITGGLAKSGSVGGGAAVNVYGDQSSTKAIIDNSTITFNSDNAKTMNVSASNNHTIIEGAVGVGIASDDTSGSKAAIGGSFNTNNLKDTTEAKITNSTITNNADIKVDANSTSTIWNIGGDLGFAKGSNSKLGIGAGVAGNLNLLKETINSEISGSTLTNVKDVDIQSQLKQEINSIGIAGAIVKGARYSFTIDGALGIDLIENTVSSLLKNSTITSIGDIKTLAKSELTGKDLTGGVDFSSATSSLGVGIGSIVEVDNSQISSKINNSKIKKSKSIEVKADSSDDRKFLAANLGIQTGEGITTAINANGVVSVLKSTINSAVLGGSELNFDGDININSIYTNKNQGITAVADKAKKGLALGANVILNHYGNEITSLISSDSKISNSANIGIGAKSSEYINSIPAAISIAEGGVGAVAANITVNTIKDKTNALAYGNMTTLGNLTVAADSETTIYNRGGTLSLASASSTAASGGAINVDYIGKTVNAQIGSTDSPNTVNVGNNTSVTAVSTNSFGGTKNSSGNYNRDDITSDSYQDNLMKKDSDNHYSGINYDNDFSNWNMIYNLSAGASAAIAGSVVVKTIDNTVKAQVVNSNLTSNNLNLMANDYSVKNLIVGQIEGSGTAAIGAQRLVTKDNSNTSAIISNGSNIKVTDVLNISAVNTKDNNQVVVAANGAGKVAGNVTTLDNTVNDNNTAKIENSTVKSGTLNITADEDMNASRVVVAVSGSANVAINVSPLINEYKGTTISQIANSTINNANITLQSDTDIKTRDIAVGVAGAGTGFVANGLAIKNTYNTTTKSIVDTNSIINTTEDIILNANSILNSNNWIVGFSAVGEGASAIIDVMINNITSNVEASISDSNIINAGNITLNTNKDKTDIINNYALSGNVAGEGLAASSNMIFNIYDNTITAAIYNTTITNSSSITAQAFADRSFENDNVGLAITGIGADLLANALVNNISSNIRAYIDAQSKIINTTGELTVAAESNTFSNNTMGFGIATGLGAALGANINLYNSDSLVSANILSNTDGQINAGSVDIDSYTTDGLKNINVGVSAGLVGIAGDVVSVKIGKRTGYSDSEKQSGIDKANERVKATYNNNTTEKERNYNPDTSTKTSVGAISNVNGNLKSENDINITSESKLKGEGNNDKLSFTNTQVTAGLGSGSVGVRNIQLENNTVAEITGGKVESETGDISINSNSSSNVDITNVKVDVSGLTFSGGSTIYNNKSNTTSQIADATIKSNDINIISNSTNNSTIDSTNVVVTGGQIVAVDLSENKDTNNNTAMITGNTNIDAIGKLTVHSTANTDLKSTKATVSVAGVNFVSVSKNEVDADTVSKAIIQNVNGKIKANGIDIITDYDTMSAFSKANVTAVKLGDLYSGDSSGANMNAKFTSGIDSLTDLIIENSGKTSITTAKNNGSNIINATSEINNVHVSLEGYVAESSANTTNTATSNTILKAKEHKADSLDINSYLNSKADATAGSVKATVGIGVNLASTDAHDTSTLNVDIAGQNNITGNAIINATHNAQVNSDLSAFNFGGLIGGGQRVRINTETVANTTGNIGGNFNADNTNINFNTIRSSVVSKSSGSGSGIVNVNDAKAVNKLNGKSTLNITNFNSDSKIANNSLSIQNISNNTYNITSHDGSGGFINVSENDTTTDLSASTITNIIDSNINSNNNVLYNTVNNTTVKDTASIAGGGFVAVMDNEAVNNYTSSAKLSLQNSTINANNIELQSLSNVEPVNEDDIAYVGKGGGFIAENGLKLTNNITQTSEIDLKNSSLHADDTAQINALTTSRFKQKTDSAVSGFVAMPRSKNWLNVTNNNILNVDSSSKVEGEDQLVINFDSNNTLEARAVAASKHFGFKDPVAESYISLIINNTLQNDGSLKGGDLVDINFMDNSINDLTQYAHTECKAAIATTSEDGKLTKTINNVLNITSDADITSNKDVEIKYSPGNGDNNSTISWDTTSYGLFGIPIHNSGSHSNIAVATNNALNLNGKIVAGLGNSKYLKINSDGTIDTLASSGFDASDYSLTGGEIIDGQQIKDKKLENIQIKIDNSESSLNEITNDIEDLSELQEDYVEVRAILQDIVDELNELTEDGYIFEDYETDADGNSAFNSIIQQDLKLQVVGSGTDQLTETEYTTLLKAYQSKTAEIEDYNNNNPDDTPLTIPTLSEFLTNYDLADNKKNTVIAASNVVTSNFGITDSGEFTTYKSLDGTNYIAENAAIIQDLSDVIQSLDDEMKPYMDELKSDIVIKSNLTDEIASLNSEKARIYHTPASEYAVSEEEYAVVFNDIYATDAHIIIDGITNSPSILTGSGTLNVASQGVKIDNYSTRSLIFNTIDLVGSYQNGLYIGGKNFAEFANSDKAVNGTNALNYMFVNNSGIKFENIGTEGIHYISNSDSISNITGITVNNFYDTFNPFASTLDITNPTLTSNITFNGNILSNNNFNVFNDSGSITVKKLDRDTIEGAINLIATKGDIDLTSLDNFALKENDNLFAGNSISVTANSTDIKGNITAGYNSDLTFTITDEMLSNLTFDPTTGETNLINLGDTPYLNTENNIKAIYKDGQIYLFNINNEVKGVNNADRGKISINSTTNSITGTIKLFDGYQNIKIDNKTYNPLIVSNITNQKSSGGLYINGTKDTDATTISKATTNITSNGNLVLDGIIKNDIVSDLADTTNSGLLQIVANNGLNINKKTDAANSVLNSIYNGGTTSIIINNGESNINGNIANFGDNINITNNGTSNLNIMGNIENTSDSSTSQIAINSNGQTTISSAITSKTNGNIIIDSNGIELTNTSTINTKNNDIKITNKSGDNTLALSGNIKAENGNISITNNGSTANIAGKISDEKGDITIANTSSNMTISSVIEHDLVNQSANGIISILNSGNGELDIQADIKTYGAGKVDTTDNNILKAINIINNNIDSKKLSLSNNISARLGNIYIKDSSSKLTTIANISSTDNGNIIIDSINGEANIGGQIINHLGDTTISSNGTKLDITSTIMNNNGNISITNTNGSLTTNGTIEDTKGNVSITNSGTTADINGTILAKEGNISVSNSNAGALNILGNITNQNGKIDVTNSSNNGINFKNSSVVENVKGDTTVTNNNGNLNIEENATIKNTELGNILVENKGSKLTLAGILQHLGIGNISVKNNGAEGLESTSTNKIAVNEGNLSVENTNGTLTTTGTIEDTKGNVSITNSGSTADINGTVLAKKGNISVSNTNSGALNILGKITNQNGTTSITNSSDNGLNFKSNSVVENVKGDTTVTNNNGNLNIEENATIKNTELGNILVENKGSKLTLAGILQHLGIGNVSVKNSGTNGLEVTSSSKIAAAEGNISVENTAGTLTTNGSIEDTKGNVSITNSGTTADINGTILAKEGNISVSNSNAGALNILGNITNQNGKIDVTNSSDDGLNIITTGTIYNNDGNIKISNTGSDGINIEGLIKADKQNIIIENQNSDIKIGEYASTNDNYINALTGNVTINQTNGDIINNITDPDTSAQHQNYDLGTPNQAYKTLITAGNDLTIIAKDGNIGTTSNSNPGFSIDSSTRDYTESLNVNVTNNIIAKAINENSSDTRLINIRAKDSNLNIKDVTSDGNVILTAADWKQADTRPTPEDEQYYKGYSVFNTANGDDATVTGQNISIIASDQIGDDDKKLIYLQDTLNAPNSSVSFESENDLNITGRSNSTNETKIYQIISKHGDINLDFESDSTIKEITANKGLKITQKAQNLTIVDLGMPVSSNGASTEFDDMLNPHDDLVYGVDPVTPEKSVVPNYINIRVLDAMDNADRSESNLRIYNATVAGNHGENTQYYENGTRLADVTLMADNIYANSSKAPNSTVSTKANPNGYQPTKTYTNADFGGDGSVVYEAKGINSYGEGEALSLDILGVDKDLVDEIMTNPNRNQYNTQKTVNTTPSIFYNVNDELTYYDADYKAKNVSISVNDYSDTNRGVVFDTLYANNAYINTSDTNLNVTNGYITNYAEIRNNNKIATVDNDFRRIVKPSDIQLYTQKTGSFALDLNNTINMRTTAPTVYNNPYMLVNGYHSEWNFVNKGQKESKDLIDNTKMRDYIDKYKYNEPQKRISERFDTTSDADLRSNYEIYDISTTGVSVKNDKDLKLGKKTSITIKFDDVDITLDAKVVKLEGNKAGLEFIDMPQDVANKILYKYMQKSNSMKSNLMTSSYYKIME